MKLAGQAHPLQRCRHHGLAMTSSSRHGRRDGRPGAPCPRGTRPDAPPPLSLATPRTAGPSRGRQTPRQAGPAAVHCSDQGGAGWPRHQPAPAFPLTAAVRRVCVASLGCQACWSPGTRGGWTGRPRQGREGWHQTAPWQMAQRAAESAAAPGSCARAAAACPPRPLHGGKISMSAGRGGVAASCSGQAPVARGDR